MVAQCEIGAKSSGSRILAVIVFLVVVMTTACATTTAPTQQHLFAFHDNFWLNLHLFTRLVARGESAPGNLSPEERATWDAAVRSYAPYTKRDLLFDDGMVAIQRELARCEKSESLDCATIDPELKATLLRIAPIYWKYWWPKHHASNEKFISDVEPLIARYGPELSRRVAAAYGQQWPPDPIPVDVTITAGANAAYTLANPTYTTIASNEPTYAGFAALEILFHESSHRWGSSLLNGVARVARAHQKKLPPQLWHAVLFHTAGELTRRVLKENGIDYVEYAKKNDVYSQLCGAGCLDRVAAAWDPHLDGTRTFDEALEALIASWPD